MNASNKPADNPAESGHASPAGSVTCWIDLFRQGDEVASLKLWNRYFAPLVAIARSKLGEIPSRVLDAEDIALSAFHAFYRSATAERFPELQDRDGLWQSLLLITSGKVLDAKRREFSQKRGGMKTSHSFSDFLEVVESDDPDPLTASILAEEIESLFKCLGDRELQEIALLKLEGCTNEEVATKLDCSDRTVKRRLAIIRRIWLETNVASQKT